MKYRQMKLFGKQSKYCTFFSVQRDFFHVSFPGWTFCFPVFVPTLLLEKNIALAGWQITIALLVS